MFVLFFVLSAVFSSVAFAADSASPASEQSSSQAATAAVPVANEKMVSPPVTVELTSLRLMLAKGVISEAEYQSAVADLVTTSGSQTTEAPTLLVGRWATTFYGFVEADQILDTTQSFNDLAGMAQVSRPGTYAGEHDQLTFGVRNSRLGFRLKAPEFQAIRTSALLEMDFLGNQPTTVTEAQFFTNPAFRIRHFYMKIETNAVDFLIGQYWQLFGWQSTFHPNSVQIQGLAGQLYSRTPQVRISKTVKPGDWEMSWAVAAARPPERASGLPEIEAGWRIAYNGWTGRQTTGATGSQLSPLSVAVTGDLRFFRLDQFSAAPKSSINLTGGGGAVDAFIPLIPAKTAQAQSLSLNGEYAYGLGTADMYSGLSGGVASAALPNPGKANPAPVYTPNVDASLADFSAAGIAHLVVWRSWLVGVQYYLPGVGGRMWVAANYSRTSSTNSDILGAVAKTRNSEEFVDGNLFGDITPAVRLGLEYAHYWDVYNDGTTANNNRIQLSAFYLF